MDTPKTITCVEWCFGYGGNHIGLKRIVPGLRCIAASEIEAYAIANLVAKIEAGLLDPFPIWTDVKTFPCELFRDLVDIFIASYPCQPFSSSGKRKGEKDPRHLWPFVRRAAEIIRPRFVFLENVEGHVSLGLREVLTELALLGYRVENSRGEPTWGIFSAAEAGAPQNRKRVFILAKREDEQGGVGDYLREQAERFYTRGFFSLAAGTGEFIELENPQSGRTGAISTRPWNEGAGTTEPDWTGEGVGQANPSGERRRKERPELKGRNRESASGESGSSMVDSAGIERQRSTRQRDDRPGRSSGRFGEGCLGVGQADAKCEGCEGDELSGTHDTRPAAHGTASECRPLFWPGFVSKPGQDQNKWEPPRTIETKRGLGGGVNGRSANVDRLRLLGNGVYPATAAKAFCELIRRHD